MSGGGFILSKQSKIFLVIIIALSVGLGILSFIKAFPFNNVLNSVLLIVAAVVLFIIALIITVLIMSSK